MNVCNHPKYADSHCAENDCSNYYGACPKHAPSGSPYVRCSIDKSLTFDDLVGAMLTVFPNGTVGEDNDGQIIIYTNKIRLWHLTKEESDEIVDLPDNWGE